MAAFLTCRHGFIRVLGCGPKAGNGSSDAVPSMQGCRLGESLELLIEVDQVRGDCEPNSFLGDQDNMAWITFGLHQGVFFSFIISSII